MILLHGAESADILLPTLLDESDFVAIVLLIHYAASDGPFRRPFAA